MTYITNNTNFILHVSLEIFMAAQILKRSVAKDEQGNAVTKIKTKRVSKSRELSLDMIKPENPGGPVAHYIYDHVKAIDMSNTELAHRLGYNSHTNMSMVKTGAARLPIVKAPILAEILDLPLYEFGRLVAENNIPKEVEALESMGIICKEEEHIILSKIKEKVPAGDYREFTKKLDAFLESWRD